MMKSMIVLFLVFDYVSCARHMADLCRSPLDDELCNLSMPITNGTYEAVPIYKSLFIRLNRHPVSRLGADSDFLPVNCHLVQQGEALTEENAFVWNGCSWKEDIAIYKSKKPIRVEFNMASVLGTFNQNDAEYYVKCTIAECTRDKKSENECPEYDHCGSKTFYNPPSKFIFHTISRAALKVQVNPDNDPYIVYRNNREY